MDAEATLAFQIDELSEAHQEGNEDSLSSAESVRKLDNIL